MNFPMLGLQINLTIPADVHAFIGYDGWYVYTVIYSNTTNVRQLLMSFHLSRSRGPGTVQSSGTIQNHDS